MKYSIITPVYNREDCIERCILSVANQSTNYGYEHIIVDDCSLDNTVNIISKLQERYRNIKLIQNTENSGPHFSFMKGVKVSKGEFIIRVDSDDMLSKNALETIFKFNVANKDIKYFIYIPDDRKDSLTKIIKNEDSILLTYKDFLSGKIAGDFLHVIKREVLLDYLNNDDFLLYKYLRGHEGYNFFRFYKAANKILLVNRILYLRDRNRKDAITNEYHLTNNAAIERTFLHHNKIISLYDKEQGQYDFIGEKEKRIKKYFLLGLLLSKYPEIKKYYNCDFIPIYQKIIFNTRTGKLLSIVFKILLKFKHIL